MSETNIKPGDTVVVSGGSEYTVISREEADSRAGRDINLRQDAIVVDFPQGVGAKWSYVLPSEVTEVRSAAPFVPSFPTQQSGWNADVIDAAIEYDRTILFKYDKGCGVGSIEQRSLQPEALTVSRAGAVSVVGFDPDRRDVRAYRLDRIQGFVEGR